MTAARRDPLTTGFVATEATATRGTGAATTGLARPAAAVSTTGGAPSPGRALRPVFLGLMLALMLAALDSTIVAAALPTIVGELGNLGQLALVVTAYLLAATVGVPIWGGVSDQLGRKRVFQAAIATFIVGAALSGAATSLPALVAFRFLQGAGAGGLIALTQTIIADLVAPRERGRYAGYIGSVFGIASILGPVLGGLFVDVGAWRGVFWVMVPLGVAALVVLQRLLHLPAVGSGAAPEAVPVSGRLDVAGSALLAIGVGCVFTGVSLGGRVLPWLSAGWFALVGVGVACLVGLPLVERRARNPILPPELFRNRVFLIGSALGLATGMGMFVVIVFMPLYLQIVVGVTATASGLLLVPLLGGMIAGTIGSGRAIVRWGRYKPFPVAGSILMLMGLLALATLDGQASTIRVVAPLVGVGAGLGMIVQVVVLAVQNAVDQRHLGSATSLTQFFRTMGGTVGVTVAGVVLQARVSGGLPADALAALPAGTGIQELLNSPASIAALSAPVRAVVEMVLGDAIGFLFAMAVPMAAGAVVLACVLPQLELRRERV